MLEQIRHKLQIDIPFLCIRQFIIHDGCTHTLVIEKKEKKKEGNLSITAKFTLKSGSTVCFLNEPIINNELGSMLIIFAYVDFLLKEEKEKPK